ncbi:MAG TPA: M23 family metallopeptidase [Ensifer sp.]|nr:M23 family metallopeptidase [Ensifer sp.]
MTDGRELTRLLGNEPALLADGRRAPDRREISFRWLSGTFLTGITSTILMGVALTAALDGRRQLAIPAEAYASARDDGEDTPLVAKRGGRLIATSIAAKPADKQIMEVSTMIQQGGKEVVRRQPFEHVKMALAAAHATQESYPEFDPLAIFSSGAKPPAPSVSTGQIYGSDVESEVSLETSDFPTKDVAFNYAPAMTLEEIEETVRTNGSVLTDGNSQVASLYYVDPRRFAASNSALDITSGLTAKVIESNMSVAAPEAITTTTPEYADDIIPIRSDTDIASALSANGYSKKQADLITGPLSEALGSDKLHDGNILRMGIMQAGEDLKIVRASIYQRDEHQVTIALDDKGNFVQGTAPPNIKAMASALDDNLLAPQAGSDLPSVYDGIYRASLSYGMGLDLTNQIVKLLANSVDFQAQLHPTDKLEAFFSVADQSGKVTKNSELLFLYAKFGDTETRLYRFQDPVDDSVDYYGPDGKSIHQFLLRNPVPGGIFKSGFGMRRHPILGYMRMHTGVDWAAPRGTPIIATGNGTVEKAGWDRGGYGNQTIIRHANGYETSYNHQSAIAKDVVEGAKIHQGQVIGWIGTTGQSTGPHLHYEMIVNGNKVDPLKIRLPDGKSLSGDALAKFGAERKRIDALLGHEDWNIASN